MQTIEVEEFQELDRQLVLPSVTVFANDASLKLNPMPARGAPPPKAAFPITCRPLPATVLTVMLAIQGRRWSSKAETSHIGRHGAGRVHRFGVEARHVHTATGHDRPCVNARPVSQAHEVSAPGMYPLIIINNTYLSCGTASYNRAQRYKCDHVARDVRATCSPTHNLV